MWPGPAPDQIERKARKDVGGEAHRRARLRRRVAAAEKAKGVIVQRLHADRQSVYARLPKASKTRRLGGGRVCFQRNLYAGVDRPARGDAIENRPGRRRVHQRWRAAAEEYAADRPAECFRRYPVQLAKIGVTPSGLVDAVADVAIKVAVGALRAAERPVDVDGQSPSLTPSLSRRERETRAARG